MKKRLALLVLVIIGVIVVSFLIYKFMLPAPPQPLITKDELIANQIQYFDSLYRGNCTSIADQEFDPNGTVLIYVNASSSLLFAYTEMFKVTNNETYLHYANIEANCIQNQLMPFNIQLLRSTFPSVDSLTTDDLVDYYLADNLYALSDYTSLTNNNYQPYLTTIANILANSQIGGQYNESYVVSKQKIILALLRYYNISGDYSVLKNATLMLSMLEQKPVLWSVEENANFLAIYSSLYQISPDKNIAASVQNYIDSLMLSQKQDGSFNFDLLQTFRAVQGLDVCQQYTGNTQCAQSLGKALSYLARNVGTGKSTLVIDNSQPTSIGSQLAVLFVKYKDEWSL